MWTLLFNHRDVFSGGGGDFSNEDISNYLSLLVYSLCERPAEVLGLQSLKGTIEKGKQADIVVFDPDTQITVTENDIYNKYP